jgi:succinate-semialdehyde dehydrogenase/glutarate-semialdehyde dehydrogenase
MINTTIETRNPATMELLHQYSSFSSEDIERIVESVGVAQKLWAADRIEKRAACLRSIALRIRDQRMELAFRIVFEMGKPITEALGEIDKCAWVFDYYADEGPRFLQDELVSTDATRSWVAQEALGVVLAVMPWNFPWWQVARFAAPALLSGNAALLKHSPNVTGCALDIEKVFTDAGLPKDLFRTLIVSEPDVPKVTSALIADPRIAAVSLTGSERAGIAVGAAAGSAIKPSLLELGGSDPFIVLDDANLDKVLPAAIKSRFLNCGQSCLAAKRFIVHATLYDEFVSRFGEMISDLLVGNPADNDTLIGPMARADLVDDLERQLRESIDSGASVVVGGNRIRREGAWFEPTLIADVTSAMPVMTEETFGPVAAVISFRDDDEAIAIANDTRYGLAVGVWSADERRALTVARGITSGAAFVNAAVASDPRLPFGGTKRSGYGRELGAAGARAFTNSKTYFVNSDNHQPASD